MRYCVPVIIFWMTIVTAVAEEAAPLDPELARIVKLLNGSKADQKSGLEAIKNLIVTPAIGREMINLSAETYPNPDNFDSKMIGSDLLEPLIDKFDPSFVPAIERVYDGLANTLFAREAALSILAKGQTPESLALFAKLLLRPSSKTVNIYRVANPKKIDATALAKVYPAIVDAISNLEDRNSLFSMFLDGLHENYLKIDDFPALRNKCVEEAAAALDDIENFNKNSLVYEDSSVDEKSKKLPANFETKYAEFEIILDLLRYTNNEETISLLRRALALQSKRLRIWALASLVFRKQAFDPKLVEELAETPSSRWLLWQTLEENKHLDLFPEKYKTQRSMAEMDMVHWLEFPTELEYAPQKLELLKIVQTTEADGRKGSLYIFKYEHDRLTKGAWFVGVAGTYYDGEPLAPSGSQTFSRFEKLEKMSLDEHIKKYIGKE